MEYSDDKEYACCTLASICLSRFVEQNSNITTINKVTIYTKDECNYCKLTKMLCKQYNLDYNEINLTDKPEELEKAKQHISEYGGEFTTFPQIIIANSKDETKYIGGYSEFEEYTRPVFNFKKLMDVTKVVTNNLDRVIDLNYYPVPETKLSNTRHRPLGIGVRVLQMYTVE